MQVYRDHILDFAVGAPVFLFAKILSPVFYMRKSIYLYIWWNAGTGHWARNDELLKLPEKGIKDGFLNMRICAKYGRNSEQDIARRSCKALGTVVTIRKSRFLELYRPTANGRI
jgi:hypothetical protein